MGMLNWFSRAKPSEEAESSGLTRADSELAAGPTSRKSERMARRELLYAVVRESMIKAGVLSSHYRFKVLSLDKRGSRFLLMVDLDGPMGGGAPQLAQLEATIAEMARARHDLLVKAVYWRQRSAAAPVPTLATRPAEPHVAVAVAPPPTPAPGPAVDPIDDHEIAAFRQALADGAPRPTARDFEGQAVHGPQSYTLLTGFEDTEMHSEPPQASDLSTTQPGDLR